ncbi:MAG: hypothetical protein ACD_77C00477G0005 [uncultured bacterium]|nr:MAG: hypothetical protein ACD_77C00477G0005 [uncultured bacterium]HBY02678.1 1-(5-phosphoribosyl)-5-[(5-phosphoribosylamino)methylideneamino]imidazole-4-carboxamide isomerase [Rikenellaceae bacterium]
MKSKIEIIPAIDIIEGKCVRLAMGDYGKPFQYSFDPLELAVKFENMGMKKLHLIDLDGARGAKPRNLEVLERIASGTSLFIEFGGGIKSLESAGRAISAGARRIIAGSIAVTNPVLTSKLIDIYGSEKIVLGLDLFEGKIAINGWIEKIDNKIKDIISFYTSLKIKTLICTDISKDGMLSGPAFDLYKTLSAQYPQLDIIASGGVSSLSDIALLNQSGVKGVIVGKAFYDGVLNEEEIRRWSQNE